MPKNIGVLVITKKLSLGYFFAKNLSDFLTFFSSEFKATIIHCLASSVIELIGRRYSNFFFKLNKSYPTSKFNRGDSRRVSLCKSLSDSNLIDFVVDITLLTTGIYSSISWYVIKSAQNTALSMSRSSILFYLSFR